MDVGATARSRTRIERVRLGPDGRSRRGGLDHGYDVVGVGDHGHVIRRDLRGCRPIRGGELSLCVRWDRLISFRDEKPGR